MCINNGAKDEHSFSITSEVTHTFNPTAWKAVNVRPAWVTVIQASEHPEHKDPVSKKKQTKRTKRKSVKCVTRQGRLMHW